MESSPRKPIEQKKYGELHSPDDKCGFPVNSDGANHTQFEIETNDNVERTCVFAIAAFVCLGFRYQRGEKTTVNFVNPLPGVNRSGLFDLVVAADTSGKDLVDTISGELKGSVDSVDSDDANPFGNIRFTDSTDPAGVENELARSQTEVDLTIGFDLENNSLDITLSVDETATDGITSNQVAVHFENIFNALRDSPNTLLSEITFCSPEEIKRLKAQGNQTSAAIVPVHRLIEEQARLTPESIAVSYRQKELSFIALNEQSNQIARFVATQEIAANRNILVCLQPSLESITTMLGIWKAGHTYVPIDPEFPTERIQHIVADADAELMFIDSELLKTSGPFDVKCIASDDIGAHVEDLPASNPEGEVDPDSVAYIVYTSGTTGLPKGVMTTHGNLSHYCNVAIDNLGFDKSISIPSIARSTFSITFFERVMPLVAGGKVVLLDRDNILNFQLLIEQLRNVNTVHTSPSLFKKLIEFIDAKQIQLDTFDHLEHVSTGGDMVPPDVLEGMKRVFRNAEIFVLYGCSEVSCMATFQYYPRTESVSQTFVGKPFNNVEIRLFDRFSNLVPHGVTGEVYIGGAGVSHQYLHRPELTEEKFIDLDGQRFYRTGDRGRRDTDGRLEILGRTDFQIKLRGIRIEPAEIETQLRKLPEVREAIVSKKSIAGTEMLVAYIVAADANSRNENVIRKALERVLPEYLIPSVFQFLDALPLNFNQKVDRNALPDVVRARNKSESKQPQTELEKLIFRSWASVLGTKDFGTTQHFFELGGHSLLLAEVLAELETEFDQQISLSLLLDNMTIESLAEALQKHEGASTNIAVRTDTKPPSDGRFPLSFGQKRIWFSEELSPRTAVYNIPVAVRLSGALNTDKLEHSLKSVAAEHPILNSRFDESDGIPFLEIDDEHVFELRMIETDKSATDSNGSMTRALIEDESNYCFDLTTSPLIRGLLIREDPKNHVLVLNFHHIVFDAWSIDLFFEELSANYSGSGKSEESELESIEAEHYQFVEWQTEIEKNRAFEPSLEFWKNYLTGSQNSPLLPADNTLAAPINHEGDSVHFEIDSDVVTGLLELGRGSQASLFMTLLASFAVLLQRHSGENDIVLGTPVSNRDQPEFRNIIGFMVNTIALRLRIDPGISFIELLEATRESCIAAYKHYDAPFEMVVEHVHPVREGSGQPLFRTMFVLQELPTRMIKLEGITTDWQRTRKSHSMFDLSLWMTQTEDGLLGEWEYSSNLFSKGTIERISGHFETLLRSILATPNRELRSLSVMSEVETAQLVEEWNETKTEYSDKRVFELFEEQVKRDPNSTAIEFQGKELSYQDLNSKANQIARFLLKKGAAPGDKIGICLDRSTTLIASMLAVQKIGCSYVPIDPSFPSDRISFVIDDAQASLVVSNSWSVESLTGVDQEILDLDSDHGSVERLDDSNPGIPVTAASLAYSIYTSGSTGLPKGVNIPHLAVTNFVESMASTPGIEKRDSVLAITTVSFDIAVLEIFVPLTRGARIILADEETARDVNMLRTLIDSSSPTVIQATPATWQMLITNGWEGDQDLRALCGGEALTLQLARSLRPRVKELWNMYGPTEATVWSCIEEVEKDPDRILIGNPISNTTTHVIDSEIYKAEERVELVPLGVTGELVIGGVGLAEGYHNRAELTADRFIEDPFCGDGSRLYRTGDLARRLPNGKLECLGRNDNQIKLRGYRIELGEIESLLEEQELVRQAVADVRTDSENEKALVSYLTTDDEGALDIAAIRRQIRKSLPEYMVPSQFYVIEKFPLTPNGKTDRNALRELRVEAKRSAKEDDQPRDAIEEKLVEIWKDILGTTNIGIDDSFFEIGGHSLKAVRMFARLEEEFRKSLPLATLFEAQTIRELALLLRDKDWSAPESSLVPIQPNGTKTPFFCMHAAGGNVLFYKDLAKRLGTERPFYGLQARKLSGQQIGHESIQEMSAYYIKEIIKAQPSGPYLIGGSSYGGLVAWEVAKQLTEAGEEVGLLALFDTFGPGYPEYLSNTSPWKTRLFSITRRIQNHFVSISMLDGKERVAYIKDKLQKGRHRIGVKYRNRKRARARKRYETMEKTLPNDLIQLEDKISEAGKKYQPVSYPGRVGIFRASNQPLGIKPDPMIGWSKLAVGDTTVIEVPGHHGSIVREPYAKNLVEVLEPIIDEIFIDE